MNDVDWMWVYENPKEAAAEIERLRAQLASARKALEDTRQRIHGPANAQMWDIRQIVDTALSLTDEKGK